MTTQDNKEYLTPLTVKLQELEKEGYTEQFVFANGVLKDSNGQTYQAGDLKILKEFRFEGESNPDDMSILYALESDKGNKGTVVTAYGTYADELAAFMKDVEEVKE